MWNKANIFPIHKVLSNWKNLSSCLATAQLFEKKKNMFNSLFKHLDDHNLLNSNQSGFYPGDPCVYQLLIADDIYKAFDTNPCLEVRSVFLDLSKGLHRVLH